MYTVNVLNKLKHLPPPLVRRRVICKCKEGVKEDEGAESLVTYHEPLSKTKKSCFIRERSLWSFVNSDQWVDAVVITCGRLLDNLVFSINKLLSRKKILVYKTLQYQTLAGDELQVEKGKEDDMKTLMKERMEPVRRITKEYYFPATNNVSDNFDPSSAIMKAYKLKQNVNQWLERINYRRDDVTRKDVAYLDTVTPCNDGRGQTYPVFFLPRMNRNFESECEQGVRKFHIFKITATDSVSWKTERQILIRKL